MIDAGLFDRVSIGDDEWSVTPQPEHLIPDHIERDQREADLQAKIEQRESGTPIVITHTDADGLTSAALLANQVDPAAVILPVEYHGVFTLRNALFSLLCTEEIEDTEIYISDLNPGDTTDIQHLKNLIQDRGCDVQWFDHHQWDDTLREQTEQFGVELVIDEDECASSIIRNYFDPDGAEWPRHIHDLVDVTKDRDLWIRHDPRSELLAVFADIAETERYVDTVLEHGPNLPDDATEDVNERLEDLERIEQMAIDRRTECWVGDYKVAFTYSCDGRSSEIGNALCEDDAPWGDHNIAVVLKTHGGMGIYSHSDRETFAQCHAVAEEFGGGGHPTASGADVPAETFRELAEYWATTGDTVHGDVLEAIHDVVNGGEKTDG